MKDSKEVSNMQWDFCERIYAPVPPTPSVSNEVEDLKVILVSWFGFWLD